MALLRKIPLIALAVVIAVSISIAAGGGSPIRFNGGDVAQAGRMVSFSLTARSDLDLDRLNQLPDFSDRSQPYVCWGLRLPGNPDEKRLCIGGSKNPDTSAGLTTVDLNGRTVGQRETIPVEMTNADPRSIALKVKMADLGIDPSTYEWRLMARQGSPDCRDGGRESECTNQYPPQDPGSVRLRGFHVIGCEGGTTGEVRNGARDQKMVALTFDDGPGDYTRRFVSLLNRKHVHGTFFEVGTNLNPSEGDLVRNMLVEGHEVGNHTMFHTLYPVYDELQEASNRIESITGFKPCLFRPPQGLASTGTIADADRAGMKTVAWDVDTDDWEKPGADEIRRRVIDAIQPGSIVLMHDGGGDRSQTLEALPQIIRSLRRQGFTMVTVSKLLGEKMIYEMDD